MTESSDDDEDKAIPRAMIGTLTCFNPTWAAGPDAPPIECVFSPAAPGGAPETYLVRLFTKERRPPAFSGPFSGRKYIAWRVHSAVEHRRGGLVGDYLRDPDEPVGEGLGPNTLVGNTIALQSDYRAGPVRPTLATLVSSLELAFGVMPGPDR